MATAIRSIPVGTLAMCYSKPIDQDHSTVSTQCIQHASLCLMFSLMLLPLPVKRDLTLCYKILNNLVCIGLTYFSNALPYVILEAIA